MVKISIQKPPPKRGDLSHVDRIPGGKRFWKVGAAYQMRANILLFTNEIGISSVPKKYHRRTNQRWMEKYVVAEHMVEKGSVFILLRPPSYKTILNTRESSALQGCYQIKVLCGEKIGWLKCDSGVSPRQFCCPVK